MEGPIKNRKRNGTNSVSIFCDVPLLRSSRHKLRVEKERKKERKKTRARLHKCCASHRIKKKLAPNYINAVLRTSLKTRVGIHKCYASHRIKNSRRTT